MPPRKRAEQTVNLPGDDGADDYTPNVDGPPDPAPRETDTGSSGPHIGTTQMRQLHALLHKHGISSDTAVHDYLSVHLGREVTSRRTLTAIEAARLIADLDRVPAGGPTQAQWDALRAPFPDEELERKPQPVVAMNTDPPPMKGTCDSERFSADSYFCGGYHVRSVHLTYVGHAGITTRLNDVLTPAGWEWEPMALTPAGTPYLSDGGMWIRLTLMGVSKIGFGDPGRNSGANGMKEAIGDAIRNAAMRFGVATYLWSKSASARSMAAGYEPDPEPQQQQRQEPDGMWRGTPDPYLEMGTSDLLGELDTLGGYAGKTYAETVQKLCEQNNVDISGLDDLPPETVRPFVQNVRRYLDEQGKIPAKLTGDQDV